MVMRSGILRHTFPVAINDRTVTLNQDLRALTPHEGINAAFVARYLKSASKRVSTECAKDGTTVNSIEVAALERLPVPIAPTNEQRRIVQRIDALFAEIAEGEAALTEARKGLDLFRRALQKAAVTGELTRGWRAANKPTDSGASPIAQLRSKRRDSAWSRVPIFWSYPIRGLGVRYLRREKFNSGGNGRLNIMTATICDHISGSRTCSKISWTCQT